MNPVCNDLQRLCCSYKFLGKGLQTTGVIDNDVETREVEEMMNASINAADSDEASPGLPVIVQESGSKPRTVTWRDPIEDEEVEEENNIDLDKDASYAPEHEPQPDLEDEDSVQVDEIEDDRPISMDAPLPTKGKSKVGPKTSDTKAKSAAGKKQDISEFSELVHNPLKIFTYQVIVFNLVLLVNGQNGCADNLVVARHTSFEGLELLVRRHINDLTTPLDMSYSTSWADKSVRRALKNEDQWEALMKLAYSKRDKVKDGEYHAKLYHFLDNQPKGKGGKKVQVKVYIPTTSKIVYSPILGIYRIYTTCYLPQKYSEELFVLLTWPSVLHSPAGG